MNVVEHSADSDNPRQPPVWLMIAVLGAAVTCCALEISMVYPSLPALIRDFGTPADVFWTVTIHYLVAASSVALSGRLGDLFGRRRVLLIVMAVSICGSLLSLSSTSLLGVIVGRGFQAVSAAAIPLSFGLIREILPPKRVAFGVGVVATIAPVAGGVGALLGGLLVDHASWRALFALSAVLGILTVLAIWWVLPARAGAGAKKIDVLGGLLVPPGIVGLLLAIQHSRSWGWLDARTLVLLGASLLLLAFWYVYESRHPDPLIDVRLIRQRQIGLANLGMALFGLGALQNAHLLSLLLQQPTWTGVGLGMTATMTGMLFTPFIVINLIGGPLSGRIAARHGGRLAALIGMALTAVGWIAIALEHSSVWFVMAMAYVQTMGIAMLFAALPNLVVEDAPSDRTSEATGVLSVVRQFAASIGTQILGYTLATSTVADPSGSNAQFPTHDAFTLTLSFIAAVCVLSVVVALMLPKRPVPVLVEARTRG